MLDELRNRCESLLEAYQHDEMLQDKYLLIKNILTNDKCFFEMDAETAINILIDLNISANTAKKVYLELIDDKNF